MGAYDDKIAKVKNAMDNRYENKQSNKKDNISGDYTEDANSYPTVRAVKTYIENQSYLTGSDITGKEDKNNKVSSWSATTNDTRYPSEKLVKDSLDTKISVSNTTGLVKNDGTIDTNTYLTTGDAEATYVAQENGKELFSGSYSDLTNKPSYTATVTSSTDGAYKIGSINISGNSVDIYGKDTDTHQDISGKANINDLSTVATSGSYTDLIDKPSTFTPSTHTHGNISDDGKIGSVSGKPLITGNNGVIVTGDFGSTSGTFAEGNHTHSQYLTSHQSLSDIGGGVTVEKQSTADTGYAHTYVVKQGGSQVGSKINIPKDLLLRSATKEVVGATPSQLEEDNNLTTGDVYLKFIVNTVDDDSPNTLIISISDLAENVIYTAGTGLTLNNGQFSISNGDISLSMLATGVQTSLGYADNWNSSVAKTISSNDITNWNNKSTLTTSDVDARINQALDDLAELIYPTSSP